MKLKTFAVMAATTLASAGALADRHVIYDYATVLDSDPIVKTFQVSSPRQECWQEDVAWREDRRGDNGVGTLVGGVLGGAIGNAVGHKTVNKKVGAVVGAVLGATLGHAIGQDTRRARPSAVRYGTQEHCEVHHDYYTEERVVGYRVKYRYRHQTYTTRMATDPGDTIKIRLAMSPVI